MSRLTVSFAAAIVCSAASSASAVEVRQVVEILAPPQAVWAKVGEWCAIKDWHPAIAACSAEKKGFRTLTLKDGGKIVEKQTNAGKTSYAYDIVDGPLPVKNYSATFTAKRDSNGNTDLVWTAKFDAAKGKTDAEAEAVIKGIFEAGLKNIKQSVKFDGAAAAAATATVATTAAAAGAAAATTAGAAKEAPAAVAKPTPAELKAQREAERAKAREERQKRIAEFKAKAAAKYAETKKLAAEKYAAAKLAAAERYAKARAYTAEKAKAAYEAAKAAYERARASAQPKTTP